MSPSVVRVLLLPVLAAVALALTGCSGEDGGGGPTTIDITIHGDSVTPNGDRVSASVGKPITLHIDADRAGELHVHSTPERELRFPAGTSTKMITIDTPGVVAIEDHALDKVIVQVQVS